MADIAHQPSNANVSAGSGNGKGADAPLPPPAPQTTTTTTTTMAKSSHSSTSKVSPRTPTSSIILPELSAVTPGHNHKPDTTSSHAHGPSRPSTLDGTHRSRSMVPTGSRPVAMDVNQRSRSAGIPSYPPRSAAISSRRGRSRSPTTNNGDRRATVVGGRSMHSSTGLAVMHKMADHPAEQANRNVRNHHIIGKQDSRDDEQVRATKIISGSTPPQISSAAAAAAAAAASFAARSSAKRPRGEGDGSFLDAAVQSIGSDDIFSSQPPRKHGRGNNVKSNEGDGISAWPVSPTESNKTEGALSLHGTPKLMTHSLESPPTSFSGKDKTPMIRDDTAAAAATLIESPLDPPDIQKQKLFSSPRTFMDDDKTGAKSKVSRRHSHGLEGSPNSTTGGIEITGSFNLFNHSFDSLGGVMPELDAGALNSFGGIGVNGTDGAGPVPSMSLSFLHQDSTKSPKLIKSPIGANEVLGAAEASKSKGRPGYPSTQVLDGSSPEKLLGLSPNDSFAMPVGGENAAMADLVLNGGMINDTIVGADAFSGERKRQDRRPKMATQPRQQTVRRNGQQRGRDSGRHDTAQVRPRGEVVSQGRPHAAPQSIGVSPLEGSPSFYFVLRRWRKCFERFTFLLPGLKVRETCSVNVSSVGNITLYSGPNRRDNGRKNPFVADSTAKTFLDPNPAEIEIATRRVIAAVCAFGGSIQQAASSPRQTSSSSIFRTKYNANGNPNLAKTKEQKKYEEKLAQRYYEHENRLSWEVEEDPPIAISSDEEQAESRNGGNRKGGEGSAFSKDGDMLPKPDGHISASDPSHANDSSIDGEPPKTKYRCKLCGLPKQNHTCPYQKSLQRSIGTTTYPVVNAHSSVEPGLLAPPLSEMNHLLGGDEYAMIDGTPLRTQSNDLFQESTGAPHVTPESAVTMHSANSPEPPQSNPTDGTPFRRVGHGGRSHYSAQRKMRRGQYSKMQGFGTELPAHRLFIESTELHPEQFRVTPAKEGTQQRGAYTYPSLPLPYGQRKRLSDSLFAMSKEVAGLTDECAVVLREARQKGKWDLGVAELLAQVVITVHCRDGDNTLEGLRKYLLSLGIAC